MRNVGEINRKLHMIICATILFTAGIILMPGFKAETVKTTAEGSDKCINYTFSVDKSTVTAGTDVQFNFEYESKKAVCSASELSEQEIKLDFSTIWNKDVDIVVDDEDQDVFNYSVENGVVTMTYKNLSHSGQTLVGFGGNVAITLNIKDDIAGLFDIKTSFDNNLKINVENDVIPRTNKVSNVDYVKLGDRIIYFVTINNDEEYVENFRAVDIADDGLEYIDGSFGINVDGKWADSKSIFSARKNRHGNLVVENTEPFSSSYRFVYEMKVVSSERVYKNDFKANYDGKCDIASDMVYSGLSGESWVEYSYGNIDVMITDGGGKGLEGAKFDIMDESGEVIESITSNSDGHAISSILPYGEYSVVETEAPDGYIIDSTPYEVSLESDDGMPVLGEVTIVNNQGSGQIDLDKVDEENNPLSGAEFTIYDQVWNKMETITTDEDGYAMSSDVPLGKYSVIETKAPDGYILDKTVYSVEINKDGDLVHLNDGKAIENVLAKGNLSLSKVDEVGNPLSDAEFTIYDEAGNSVETLITDEDGYAISSDIILGDYTVKETKAPYGYILDDTSYEASITSNGEVIQLNEGDPIVNEKIEGQIDLQKIDEDGNGLTGAEFTIYDEAGNIVEVLTSEFDGYAVSGALPQGEYSIVETKAPDGYVLDGKTYYAKITNDDDFIHINGGEGIVNRKIKGQIDVWKVDEDGNPLSDVEYTVYDSDHKVVDTFITDEYGYGISEELPAGDYTVIESKVPSKFILNKNKYSASIEKDHQIVHLNSGEPIISELAKSSIDLYKVDEEGNSLEGAEFTIFDETGNPVEELVTDKEGYAISDELEIGKYYVVESKAPDGYLIVPKIFEINIETTGVTQTLNDGEAIVDEKANDIDISLPKVEFEGQIDLFVTDENGKPLSSAQFTIYDNLGNPVEELVTDEEGYAISSNLALGNYSVIETKAPSGYVTTDKEYEVSIDERLEVAHVNSGDCIVNEFATGYIDLHKVDENGKPLAGAQFTVYDSSGKVVETIVTDEDGYAITSAIPKGNYTVIETKAPTGYVLSSKKYYAEVE